MKSYTDLEQSKKLAKILPLESADMYYFVADNLEKQEINYAIRCGTPIVKTDIPCWSLAALLNVLPSSTLDSSDDHYYRLHCMERYTDWHDSPIDVCYYMIIKLYKEGIL